MIFTTAERQLAALFYCGDNISTAKAIRGALSDITCPDTLAAARSVIGKLEAMDSQAFAVLFKGEFLHA